MADDQEIRRQITDAIIAAEVKMEFSVCLHPTNTEEQKEKFLAEEIEEPIFTYKKSQLPPVSFPDFVVHSEIDALYRDRMGHTKGLALLLQLVEQDREFSALSQVLFPVKEIGKLVKENGSLYIVKRDILIKEKNRLGGKIILFPMKPEDAFEIDSEFDFWLLEKIAERRI